MTENNFNIEGLTDKQVLESTNKFGTNRLIIKKENAAWNAFKNFIKDPMVLLLLVASSIYFFSGKTADGFFLLSAVVLVTFISAYQNSRSRIALEKLKIFSQPDCKVIRNGKTVQIKSENIVIGDCLVIEEGTSVLADGKILHSNDFSVDESLLTGESLSVFKDKNSIDNNVYHGTTAVSGLAIAEVTSIGNNTKLGTIGKSIETIKEEKTPLEIQIGNFVKKMVLTGIIVFLVVWIINYLKDHNFTDSLLNSLTLAMSIIPEEIPVAFTTFMALGAWRLMKMGIVVKQMKTVETLGSATVICTDKTGTITENKMNIAALYVLSSDKIYYPETVWSDAGEKELIRTAMFASEPIPFDPMEIALHYAYSEFSLTDERPEYKIIHEYPIGGKPPMMTHIFENKRKERIIASKGAVEALINISELSGSEINEIENAVQLLGSAGYRLLGVGITDHIGNSFPKEQQEFKFRFIGIVAFNDPPKKNISSVFKSFYNAGIAVKIVTGDNALTTSAIAKEVELHGYNKSISGDDLMKLDDVTLRDQVRGINIFTRMFPEAKLRIINALKANNEIVAMTGDGVNDGPALKAANIGIAMGKKGSEIAKQAASLILLEDDLEKMVDAVAMGRRIYSNLKKAIQYIISIHIPIIMTVFIPLALGWKYPNILSPIHVIFLELIMGPTCSIIYENEPIEKNTMLQKPRQYTNTFFEWKELATSILQGIIIAMGSLTAYLYSTNSGLSEQKTRTIVFLTLISANVSLTLVNRSFYYTIITTIKYKNNLVPIIISATIIITALILLIKPLSGFFEFADISLAQLLFGIVCGSASVLWYEILKLIKYGQGNKAET